MGIYLSLWLYGTRDTIIECLHLHSTKSIICFTEQKSNRVIRIVPNISVTLTAVLHQSTGFNYNTYCAGRKLLKTINMDFDQLLIQHIGEFGRYQKILYIALSLVLFPAAFNNMAIVFLAAEPNHWCQVSGLEPYNVSTETHWNLTIPLERSGEQWRFSQCQMYDRNFTGYALV